MKTVQEIIISAKTVDQAIAEGARELGAPEEEVKYEILQEPKKGFLGIGELPAKVKVIYSPSPALVARSFVESIVGEMEIDAQVSILSEEKDAVRFSIEGEDAGLLIGYHGETLDALQYLTGLAANRSSDEEDHPYMRVSIDAGGYREKREETLRSLARRTAAKVKRYRRSVTLEPMNPSDRRVIHSEIQGVEGVTTESVGNEGHRCVVVHIEGQPIGESAGRGYRDGYGRDGGSRRGERGGYSGSRNGSRNGSRSGNRGGNRSSGYQYRRSEGESKADAGYSIVKGGSEE